MNEEYRGLYFQNNNYNGPQKIFYEHGAHFNYMELYDILDKIAKKIKPKINSSIPKKKNISLNKKRSSSCNKKKLTNKNNQEEIYNKSKNIKENLSYFYVLKNKNRINNKKEFNNSLIIKNKDLNNLSCEKKFKNNSFNNKIKNKNMKNCQNIKYNSSIINNSMEYFFNYNKMALNNSLNSINKENKIKNTNCSKIGKKNLKFNAFALSDFSKKNDNIIFSYNKKNLKKDSSGPINKYAKFYYTEKNKNLITKENKNESINDIIISFNLNEEYKIKENLKIKNKLNITEINNIKSSLHKNNNNFKRKKNMDYFENSLHIKTPKSNFTNNLNNQKIKKYINNNKNKNKKLTQKNIKSNLNKTSIKEYLKLQKSSKNQEKPKIKIYRNNENLKGINSFFDKDKNSQLSFNNYKYNNLIMNKQTEKLNFSIDNNDKNNNLDLFKNKNEYKLKNIDVLKKNNNNSVEKRDIKKYIKNKLLDKNIKKEEKLIINCFYYKKGDNYAFSGSTKSNDSINKSKSNKNGDKKSLISTNLTSHINSRGIIIPSCRKKIDFNNV